ncbi:hypothetical protein [Pseudonocardia sp.]|uniref:hypothetical protein n=1 Tax=Pseudonocardia sp. TaxID=60912 RepID=UPI00261B71DA|nr:hypothetical protein [Pseudonocardia sp.]
MTDEAVAAWESVGEVLAGTAHRLLDAVPVTARIIADVERDWRDELGREWVERAHLVRRALVRELDATLDAAAAVADALRPGPADEETRAIGAAGHGRPSVGGPRPGGPRLGDTAVERADDERGVRIAQLGE